MEHHTTTGTSGKPLGFWISSENSLFRQAMDERYQKWAGVHGGTVVILRGNIVDGGDGGGPRWCRYEHGSLVLSSFHMAEELLPRYVQAIVQYEPRWFFAYPTAIDVLARYILRSGARVNERGNIKAVVTSSETLYPGQRESIENAFECNVFDLYGNMEETARLGECDRHEGYHDFMEYGYTEIVDGNGNPVVEEGGVGEVVTTAFTNDAMPFVRYRTGDLAEWTQRMCSCGRQLRLIRRIIGRKQDFFVSKSGGLIPMLAMGTLDTEIYANVRQFRCYQDAPGRVTLRVVRRESYTQQDTDFIKRVLRQRLQDQVDVAVEFVDNIPLGPRGKYSFLEQRLPVDSLRAGERISVDLGHGGE